MKTLLLAILSLAAQVGLFAQDLPFCAVIDTHTGFPITILGGIPFILDTANGADTGGTIAPGQRVTFRGIQYTYDDSALGVPAQIVNGMFPTKLGGTEVLVNGELAPIEQINRNQQPPFMATLSVQIPPDLDISKPPAIQVRMTQTDGTRCVGGINPTFKSVAVLPGLYTGSNSAVLVQDDGSGYLTIYGNGFGKTITPVIGGQIVQEAIPLDFGTPVQVTIDGNQMATSYVGLTPGTSGVYQLNVIAPLASGQHKVEISVGGQKTSGSFQN